MSRADVQRQAARTIRRINSIARALRPRYAAEFDRMAKEAASRVRAQGIQAITSGGKEHEQNINRLLRQNYLIAIPQGSASVLLEVRKAARPSKDPTDTVTRGALDYIETYAVRRAEEITGTTKKRLQRVLAEAIKKGWSSTETASAIETSLGKQAAKIRADVVARTETHAAYNYGSLQAAKTLGSTTKKEWVAGLDERTRPSHQDADGQITDIHSPFHIGRSSMMHPGDPGAPAEETINCRCTMVYIVGDEEDDDDA